MTITAGSSSALRIPSYQKKYKMNLKIAEIYEHNITTGLSQTTSTQVVTTDHDEPKNVA